MESRNYLREGMLLMVGGMQFILAMVIAESLYPGYSIANDYISDLGVGPSALIFNASIIIFGSCVVYAAYLFSRSFSKFSMVLIASGLGAIGVGMFPENMAQLHGISALFAFVFSGVSALYAYTIVRKPFNYLSLIIGLFIFAAILLFATNNLLGIGVGGMERMIAYPAILWVIGLGGYLAGGSK
ncbi:MAG: DUF998 domain-containing protein [Candidatus Micrarchaeota archaeon]